MLAIFRGAQRRRLADSVLVVSRSRADARAATLTVERVKKARFPLVDRMTAGKITLTKKDSGEGRHKEHHQLF